MDIILSDNRVGSIYHVQCAYATLSLGFFHWILKNGILKKIMRDISSKATSLLEHCIHM